MSDLRLIVPLLVLLSAGPASAHTAHDAGWTADPLVLLAMAAAGSAYTLGLLRLWRRAGPGRGLHGLRVTLFALGYLLAGGLLLSPLDTWAERLLSAHMIQHFGLMLVAAPLMVLGRPGLAFLWAVPASRRAALGRLAGGAAGRAWRAATHPLGAWMIYLVALWIWHMPALHQWALRSDAVHAAQHASFLGAALLLWTAVLERPRAEGRAGAFFAVFATAVHSCALAALLTTARTLWYPAYAAGAGGWGLTPLQDQQLGGLIMWVPCCAILLGAAVAVFAGLLRDAELRAERFPL